MKSLADRERGWTRNGRGALEESRAGEGGGADDEYRRTVGVSAQAKAIGQVRPHRPMSANEGLANLGRWNVWKRGWSSMEMLPRTAALEIAPEEHQKKFQAF